MLGGEAPMKVAGFTVEHLSLSIWKVGVEKCLPGIIRMLPHRGFLNSFYNQAMVACCILPPPLFQIKFSRPRTPPAACLEGKLGASCTPLQDCKWDVGLAGLHSRSFEEFWNRFTATASQHRAGSQQGSSIHAPLVCTHLLCSTQGTPGGLFRRAETKIK